MAQKFNAGLLECDFCKHVFSIQEQNFPPDLYALMVKYDISQLIWICAPCKETKERNFRYFLSLAERQREMEKILSNIAVTINELQSSIQSNASDSSLLDRSVSVDSGCGKTAYSSPMSRNDWGYVYQKAENEEASLCSVLTGCFDSASVSSGLTVVSNSQLQNNDTSKFSSSLSPSNYNGKKALGFLKKILTEKIKIDDDEAKQNKAILNEFLDKLVKAMQEGSPEFKHLYHRNYYTGSSYEELRIGKADEFDINLILKFPFQKKALKVEFVEEYPSFAKCFCVSSLYDSNPQLMKPFFENGCLMPAKVKSWMQSVISRFITVPTFEKPANVIKIEPSQSGPASTIKLTTSNGSRIDIDLVPVLEFTDPEWPPYCDITPLNKIELSKEDKFWFLVPKPFLSVEGQTPPECEQLWRIHLPSVEKRFILGKLCVKPIIKLLKLLRDKECIMKVISSYYLKTVLMWEVHIHSDVTYWNETQMGERFLEVLKKLDVHVVNGKLPHFLFPSVNLFEKMKRSHSENIHGRLKKVIKDIEKDTSNLFSVFGSDASPRL